MEAEQVTALQQARTKVAITRSDRLGTEAEHREKRDNLDLAIRRLENKLQVETIRKQTCEQPAKDLRAAYLGVAMPQSIVDELDAKAKELKVFDGRIKEINEALTDLRDRRDIADAECRLAQKAITDIEEDLRQIDRRIADIRGF